MASPLSRIHFSLTRRSARPLATLATLATAVAAALAALSLPALAQPAPAAPAAPITAPADAQPPRLRAAPEGRGMQEKQQHQYQQQQQERSERWQQRRAERMAAFKAQLQLTPAQEPAWTGFTAAMQPGQRHARLDHEGMEQLTTPERIDRMRALRTQRAAEADRRGDAVKAFYAALTAPQQKTFDAQMQKMQQLMHGRHGGHGGHGKHGHYAGPDGKHQRGGAGHESGDARGAPLVR